MLRPTTLFMDTTLPGTVGYGHGLVYGKRSADAEPEPEAKANADAEAHYALYGYYPVGYVAHPYINLYGKRSAEPAADAEPHLYGYGLGYAYRPYYGYYYGK